MLKGIKYRYLILKHTNIVDDLLFGSNGPSGFSAPQDRIITSSAMRGNVQHIFNNKDDPGPLRQPSRVFPKVCVNITDYEKDFSEESILLTNALKLIRANAVPTMIILNKFNRIFIRAYKFIFSTTA